MYFTPSAVKRQNFFRREKRPPPLLPPPELPCLMAMIEVSFAQYWLLSRQALSPTGPSSSSGEGGASSRERSRRLPPPSPPSSSSARAIGEGSVTASSMFTTR